MSAINGTVRNGRIVLDSLADWPDGTAVLVTPIPAEEDRDRRDEDGPPTPEEITQQLALMDQMEPLIVTHEEEARGQEARQSQKGFEKAKFDERAEKLRKMWE